jgi:hypothetical protein
VADNPAAPPRLLASLAHDTSAHVRCWVADNPRTQPDILQQLAPDQDNQVRWRTAEHPACPPDALRQLARDPNNQVANAASRQLSLRHPLLSPDRPADNPGIINLGESPDKHENRSNLPAPEQP